MLEDWFAIGFERTFGRAPLQDDLVVPAPRGGHRMASETNRDFQLHLAALVVLLYPAAAPPLRPGGSRYAGSWPNACAQPGP